MDKLKLFEATFQKLSSDKNFIAWYLNQYARRQQTDLAGVISRLGCGPENFYKLALCKAPERDRSDFTERLGNIAGYAGVSMLALNGLMKEVSVPEENKTPVRLPAFLLRCYRLVSEVPTPSYAVGRLGISVLTLVFFVGILSAKVDGRSGEFYSKGFPQYKDSVRHICMADNTQVNGNIF